jgi:hypothetical protein
MPKIYSYHVHLSTLPEHAFGQLRLAHAYYNRLIELENQRRGEYRTLRTQTFPTLAALEVRQAELNAQIDELEDQKKKENAKARTKVKNDPLVAQLKVLKAERKVVNASVKAERTIAKPMSCPREDSKSDPPAQRPLTQEELEVLPQSVQRDFSLACIQLDAVDLERCKAARASSGVYWTTYLRIERAVQQASKTAKLDPRFKKFKGEGCLGGQIQGGLDLSKVYLGDTHFKIDPLPDNTWNTRSGWEHAYTVAHLRIGTEGRQPIWLDLPIKLDRPLPSVGSIREVYLKVTKLGLKAEYELKICIDSPEFDVLQPSKRDLLRMSKDPSQGSPMLPTTGRCAINFGWRSLPSGDVRVAYLVDTKGHEEIVHLPQKIKGAFALVGRLQGFCDEHFDLARGELVRFLKESQEVPEWLQEMTTTIAQWRSHTRLAMIALRLRDEVIGRGVAESLWQSYRKATSTHGPLPSYEVITSFTPGANYITKLAWYLEIWRKKDKHLTEYLSNLRDKCQNQRKDLYRSVAKSISARYNVVIIDDMSLAQLTRRPDVGEEGFSSEELRASKEASPGELRSVIIEKVGKHRIEVLPAAKKTITCNHCGQDHGWDTKGDYVHLCPTTGKEVDQDWNNCMNLLQEFERSSGASNPVPARTHEPLELMQAS